MYEYHIDDSDAQYKNVSRLDKGNNKISSQFIRKGELETGEKFHVIFDNNNMVEYQKNCSKPDWVWNKTWDVAAAM